MLVTLTPPPAATARTASKTELEEYRRLQQNSTLVGCFGVVLSTLLLVMATLALDLHDELSEMVLESKRSLADLLAPDALKNVVVLVCSTLFGLSLINVVVSSLLLLSIAKRCSSMLFPWLLYHGLVFSVLLHLAVYLALSGIFLHIDCLVLAAMGLTLALAVFFKIYNEVYTLFKLMDYVDPSQAPGDDSGC